MLAELITDFEYRNQVCVLYSFGTRPQSRRIRTVVETKWALSERRATRRLMTLTSIHTETTPIFKKTTEDRVGLRPNPTRWILNKAHDTDIHTLIHTQYCTCVKYQVACIKRLTWKKELFDIYFFFLPVFTGHTAYTLTYGRPLTFVQLSSLFVFLSLKMLHILH